MSLMKRHPLSWGSPFDYPLSSRLDENDAIFITDKVLVPWENVVVHGCTRLTVKLGFIAGHLLKAIEASGTKDYRGMQANVGELIAWRNLFWGLSDALIRDPKPWVKGYLLPTMDPESA